MYHISLRFSLSVECFLQSVTCLIWVAQGVNVEVQFHLNDGFHNTGPGVGIEILGLVLLKFSLLPVEAVLSRGCCQ